MCLNGLKEFKVGRDTAFKVFEKRGKELYPIFKGNNKPVPVGKWVKERDFRRGPNVDNIHGYKFQYESGFHSFVEKSEAEIWAENVRGLAKEVAIQEVRYRSITAKGYSMTGHGNKLMCIVTKEIMILE